MGKWTSRSLSWASPTSGAHTYTSTLNGTHSGGALVHHGVGAWFGVVVHHRGGAVLNYSGGAVVQCTMVQEEQWCSAPWSRRSRVWSSVAPPGLAVD